MGELAAFWSNEWLSDKGIDVGVLLSIEFNVLFLSYYMREYYNS